MIKDLLKLIILVWIAKKLLVDNDLVEKLSKKISQKLKEVCEDGSD